MPYIGQGLTEGRRRVETFIATASQTTFNIIYDAGYVDVYQNGILLAEADYTATNGSQIVLAVGAALNDEITIIAHQLFSVTDTVSATQGGTFTGAITASGGVVGTISNISNHLLDEDDMASNDATKVPSQQSVKAYVDTEVSGLVDSAPSTLDTLNELAAALGDDANFSTTITNSIATKLPLAGGTLTGNLTMENTDAGSAAGPEFVLFRNSASAADADYLGQIKFDGKNDAGQSIVYAKITGKILDASDGTEDGIIEIAHKKAGSNNISARFRSDSLQLINGTNLTVAGTTELTGDLTVDTNTLHVDTTNNRVGIGTTSPFTRAVVGGGSGTEVLTIFSGSNGEGQIRFADGSSGSAAYQGRVEYDHVNGRLNLGAGGTTPFTIDSNSNVGIGTNSPNNYSGFTSLGINGSTGGVVEFMDDDAVIGEVFSGADYLAMGTTVAGGNLRFRTGSGSEKVRITSDGNVGIGDLTPSAKLEVAGTAKADQYLLDAIAKDISDTASDVFIYDTRKDSDGGAWRKRTQHTSWYNETLNTSKRGSRKEFPAVAVLAFNTNQELWIYDGDDPNLSLWAKYTTFTQDSGDTAAITAVNGSIYAGQANAVDAYSGNGYFQLNFAADYFFSNIVGTFGSYLQGRADGLLTSYDFRSRGDRTTSKYTVPNLKVNDIAVTVLPNAPIDSDTGLPTPTIALATNGGISVIKDDGTVVDITHNSASYNYWSSVNFTKDNKLIIDSNYQGTSNNITHVVDIPNADVSQNVVNARITSLNGRYYHSDSSIPNISLAGVLKPSIAPMQKDQFAMGGDNVNYGLDIIAEAPETVSGITSDAMIAYIKNDYNTGWMSGDIRLATCVATGTGTYAAGSNLDDRCVHNETVTATGNGFSYSPVATGADLSYVGGMSAGTYAMTANAAVDIDWSSDWYITFWCGNQVVISIELDTGSTSAYNNTTLVLWCSNGSLLTRSAASGLDVTHWTGDCAGKMITAAYVGGVMNIYVDGYRVNSVATSIANAHRSIVIGRRSYNGGTYGTLTNQKVALLRVGSGTLSAEQIKKIYEDEKVLFQENAKATLYGSSDAVTALAYDDDTELLHVGGPQGRSVFQGLRRIDNTTDAVGAAISASNGMVAED